MSNAKKEINAEEVTSIMSSILLKSPPLYINLLKAGNITVEDLQNYQFRKWLADAQFWKGPSAIGVEQTVSAYVLSQIAPAQPVNIWNNF